jgi:hypothetical protein
VQGPCVEKPPYFGIVKRAMNRPPSPKDWWWDEHMRSCGGSYTKIKEPPSKEKQKKSRKSDQEVVEAKKQRKLDNWILKQDAT